MAGIKNGKFAGVNFLFYLFRPPIGGNHFEELRARIIFAILGLVIALIVCLFFSKRITATSPQNWYSAAKPPKCSIGG
jgi:Sec-independent protein secretion pathway component TatC